MLEDIIKHLYGANLDLSVNTKNIQDGRGHEHMARMIIAATNLELPDFAAELKVEWLKEISRESSEWLFNDTTLSDDLANGVDLLFENEAIDPQRTMSDDISTWLNIHLARRYSPRSEPQLGPFLKAAGQAYSKHFLTGSGHVGSSSSKLSLLQGRCPRCKSKILWSRWPSDLHQAEMCLFCRTQLGVAMLLCPEGDRNMGRVRVSEDYGAKMIKIGLRLGEEQAQLCLSRHIIEGLTCQPPIYCGSHESQRQSLVHRKPKATRVATRKL